MNTLFSDYISVLPDFFQQSKSVIYVIHDPNFKIVAHNPLFSEHILSGNSAIGENINSYLMPESRGILTTIRAGQDRQCKVQFMAVAQQSLSFECHIYCRTSHTLIIGEKLMLSNDVILQKMGALNNEMVNLSRKLQQRNRELEHANATIRTLGGILPICSYCKGIRDDKGYWAQLEEFMSKETDVEFSHSICPDCMQKYHPDID
jgi:hypothetical protein